MSELLKLMDDMDGFSPVRGDIRITEAGMAEVNDLLINAKGWPLHKWEYMLKEAITTSDFPALFGGILDRQLIASYQAAIPDWKNYIYVGSAKDFRENRRSKVQGLTDLLDLVPEQGEYTVKPVSEAHYSWVIHKYGNQFDISFEALINDDMGAFADVAQRFASAAVFTEAYLATSLFCSATGPNAALFGAPITDVDTQQVTNLGELPLTIANLETTLGLMAAQTDLLGRPLGIRGVHLVVPPALETTGRAILTSTSKQWLDTAAGAVIPVPTANVVAQMGLQLHVNPLLPVIDGTENNNGTWYLFADKGSQTSPKAMEFSYLRGHEMPEVCMKASDKVSPMGAALSPFSGDFANDSIHYRVRICCGGSALDPRYAYAQVST